MIYDGIIKSKICKLWRVICKSIKRYYYNNYYQSCSKLFGLSLGLGALESDQ
jgi:hypothetical protein